jgi:DNA polymerase I-like protein with 3'-5' exonuclease and polymerase domains
MSVENTSMSQENSRSDAAVVGSSVDSGNARAADVTEKPTDQTPTAHRGDAEFSPSVSEFRFPDAMLAAFDTETYRFGPGNMAPRIVCLTWCLSTKTDHYGIKIGDAEIEPFARTMLESAVEKATVIVGQNVAYDMGCLYQQFPSMRELIWRAYDSMNVQCTYVREKLLDIADQGKRERKWYSLAAMSKRYFDVELDKETHRLNFGELDGVPLEQWPAGAAEYAELDAAMTRRIYQKQAKRGRALKYDFELEASRQACYAFALHLTSVRGILIDQDQVSRLLAEMHPKMEAELVIMREHKLVNRKRDGTESKSTTRIRELVEKSFPDKANLPRTPKGAVSCDAETVEQCDHPALKAYASFAAMEKIETTYLKHFREAGSNPVHASFDVLGAESGRTSSYGPNLQNQPRLVGIRECFRARNGWVFAFCDYDSQELRTLAQVCKDILGKSRLADRYREDPDFDPHTHFAAQLLKISYEEALERKKADDTVVLEFRQRAKAANFGFPGGMGAPKFRFYARTYGVELSEEESAALRAAWFNQWPEMKDYFQWIANSNLNSGGTVTQLVSGRRRAGCKFTDAANTYFQGLAAEASKSALWEVTKKCFRPRGENPLAGCRPVVFVHDEIGVECPEEIAAEAAEELGRTMVAAMQEVCPDVPARASPALMRRWSKKAKAVRKDGRLIPWEDR